MYSVRQSLWYVFCLLLAACPFAEAGPCTAKFPTSAEALSFLKAAKTDPVASPECITLAIAELDSANSKEIVDVLATYLDFRRPLRDEEKIGISLRVPITGDLYPAAGKLYSIGKPALPALVKVIAAEQSSDLTRNHAAETLLEIFRDNRPEGIRFLLNSASKQDDQAAKARLRETASQAVRFCGPKEWPSRVECEIALNSQ